MRNLRYCTSNVQSYAFLLLISFKEAMKPFQTKHVITEDEMLTDSTALLSLLELYCLPSTVVLDLLENVESSQQVHNMIAIFHGTRRLKKT